MKRNTHDIEQVIDMYAEEEKKELIKMYPNEKFENKYILFVKGELFFPFSYESIEGTIDFIYKDAINNFKTKIRTPYPNKMIKVISMMNGRSGCNYGIPILYNSFEELQELKNIQIKWKIYLTNADKKEEVLYVHVLYNLKFEYEKGKRIYSILSKDYVLNDYKNSEMLQDYIDEFQKVMIIRHCDEGDFSIKYIYGSENEDKIIQEEGFVTIMENLGMKEFINVVTNNKQITIFSYYSEENIIPDIVAKNINPI